MQYIWVSIYTHTMHPCWSSSLGEGGDRNLQGVAGGRAKCLPGKIFIHLYKITPSFLCFSSVYVNHKDLTYHRREAADCPEDVEEGVHQGVYFF